MDYPHPSGSRLSTLDPRLRSLRHEMLIHADLADGPAVGLVDAHENLDAAQRPVVRRHRLALAGVVDAENAMSLT